MKSIMIKRTPDESNNFNFIIINFNGSPKAVGEVEEVINMTAGATRLQLNIDFHETGDIRKVLRKIDKQAQKKGIEVRLKVICLCPKCSKHRNEVCDSIQWMSRWDA